MNGHRLKKLRSKSKRRSKASRPPAPVAGDSSRFPIVGVGASAGGLEAFTELLRSLPTDTGFGFVLVQHLDPQHESALSQLLARATEMPVCEVTNNSRVKPNRVYVIPPNTKLSIAKGVLKLEPRGRSRAPARSIDSFFESLAQDQKDCAIGVILSGTATDGTIGLEAIKAEGGITFAQDDSARYDSMPRSAAAAGCVDFILGPAEIACELGRLARHPYLRHSPAGVSSQNEEEEDSRQGSEVAPSARDKGKAEANERREDGYKKILLLLRGHSGVDFSLYKSTTVRRRIHRRMLLSRQQTLEDYIKFLRGNTTELDALYSDALINVTSFFRNPEAFDVLQRKIFPKLLQQRGDDPLRVWVLGCSSGQEAYSIAMVFAETIENAPRVRKVQVFATDLNDASLDKARHGLYPRNLLDGVSPERLRRFFVEEDGGYRIVKPLREMVVFARQNLTSDPPFSRMDLISCRNLLIYLDTGAQKKAFPTFHYALKPGGYLFLGASESIGGFTDLFEPADKKQKIYSKKSAVSPAFHMPPAKNRGEPRVACKPLQVPFKTNEGRPDGFGTEANAQREADRVTVNQFAPPAVLINSEMQILQFRGATGTYLQPPTGKASFDVLKMARDGLMLPLRAAINKAKKGNKPVRSENVRVTENGEPRTVNLEVIPLKNLREPCFLVLFDDTEKARLGGVGAVVAERPEREPKRFANKMGEARRVEQLETELSETRDYLQSVQEQQEAANEELQASNEEVQSANEELQSINEELESANEELLTVNEEMANRNTELNRLNSDLVNLQTSTKLIILLLGRDLTIRRFSLPAERQFNLLASDIGRSIGNIRHSLGANLERFVSDVIANVHEKEREVQDKQGRWYSLRARPYLTADNKVDGAVLVMMDINDLKHTQQKMKAAQERAEKVSAESLDLSKRLNFAHEEERQRIGREIHDEVGQTLTGLKLYLQDIKKNLTPESVDEAQRIASEAQEELRRISLNLHPQVLSDFGLKRALEWRIKRFHEHTGITVELDCPEIPKDALSPQTGITAYRIVQEALTNVAKHSGASKASVKVQLDADSLGINIRDRGKGFKTNRTGSDFSTGIRGMGDRTALEGGTFELVSTPGKGTEIVVSLPAK